MTKFIVTHKPFDIQIDPYVKEQYTVLSPKGVTVENWSNIIYFESELDNRVWSEISAMDWIYRKVNTDWVEINHYRRLLNSYYEHISVAQPFILNCSLADNYNICHNIQDLAIVSNIIKNKYPGCYDIWMQTIKSCDFYPYNLVSFPINVFREYMSVMMTILYEYCKIVNCFSYDDFMKRVTTEKVYTENNNARDTRPEYQVRIPGFLAERITTWFIHLMICKGEYIYPCSVTRTENNF